MSSQKRTLTDGDIEFLREFFVDRYEFEEKIQKIVKETMKEEIGHLPTKDEFFKEMGKIYKKQQDLEDEKDMLSHRVKKHTDQIFRIEKHLNLPQLD